MMTMLCVFLMKILNPHYAYSNASAQSFLPIVNVIMPFLCVQFKTFKMNAKIMLCIVSHS